MPERDSHRREALRLLHPTGHGTSGIGITEVAWSGTRILVYLVTFYLGAAAIAQDSSQPPTAQQPPARVRVSKSVMQGLLLKRVNPNYPEDARQARIQGSVLLKVVISREGNVAEMHVPSGHPLLVPAAVDAVKRWEYRPYILNGNPVEIDSQIRANFTLGG